MFSLASQLECVEDITTIKTRAERRQKNTEKCTAKRALHKSLPAIYVKFFNCFCLRQAKDLFEGMENILRIKLCPLLPQNYNSLAQSHLSSAYADDLFLNIFHVFLLYEWRLRKMPKDFQI